MLRAFEGIHRLKDERAFLGFLFGIASRILKKQYRRKKFWALFDPLKSHAIEDKRPSPEQDLDAQFLYEAIRKLPWMYQEAVVLHFISGFSLQEIAVIQDSTLSAVKVRVMRGKMRLAKMLGTGQENAFEKRQDSQFQNHIML